MTPSRSGDNNPPAQQPSRQGGTEKWSQADLDALHELLRDSGTLTEIVERYKNAKWLRRQIFIWVGWLAGIPAAAVYFWEPIEKLVKLIRGH